MSATEPLSLGPPPMARRACQARRDLASVGLDLDLDARIPRPDGGGAIARRDRSRPRRCPPFRGAGRPRARRADGVPRCGRCRAPVHGGERHRPQWHQHRLHLAPPRRGEGRHRSGDGHPRRFRVATFDTAEASEAELVDAILGRRLKDFYPTRSTTRGKVVLSVRGLTAPQLGPIDLDVRAGETVGLTGLAGSGHDALPYLLAGVDPAAGGAMEVEGESVELARLRPAGALAAGVVLIPADRRRFGIVPAFTVAENVSLPMLTTLSRWGLLSLRREAARRGRHRAVRSRAAIGDVAGRKPERREPTEARCGEMAPT